MEILKERNKPATDVHAIRAKYQIDEIPAQLKRQPELNQSLVNIVHFEIDEVEVEETYEVLHFPERDPKLLNPTLIPISKAQSRQKFECDLCRYSSLSKALLTRHIESAHKRTPETGLKCAICLKVFRSKTGLRSHLKSHEDEKPKFQCPECNKHLSSQSALVCHQQTIHKKMKDFQCSSCSKAFATVSFLGRISSFY